MDEKRLRATDPRDTFKPAPYIRYTEMQCATEMQVRGGTQATYLHTIRGNNHTALNKIYQFIRVYYAVYYYRGFS